MVNVEDLFCTFLYLKDIAINNIPLKNGFFKHDQPYGMEVKQFRRLS